MVSLVEDLGVAGLVTLALFHPVPAAIIAGCLLAGGVALVLFTLSRIRRFWQRRKERRAARALRAAQA